MSYYIAEASFKLMTLLLLWPSGHWEYRHEGTCLTPLPFSLLPLHLGIPFLLVAHIYAVGFLHAIVGLRMVVLV